MKVIVAYATRYGSTAEIAQAIGAELTQQGFEVEVLPAKQVKSLKGIQAVVLGSPFRVGQWLQDANWFLHQHEKALKSMPVAYFTVHIYDLDDDPLTIAKRIGMGQPMRKIAQPVAETYFAGKIDQSKMSWFDRWVTRQVHLPDQDLREWDKIRAWAVEIAPKLRGE